MRVLVTGGSGFIGSHLCRALLDGGADVEVWSRHGTAGGLVDRVMSPGITFHPIDVRDAKAVEQAMRARPPDRVFHLAGQRLIDRSAESVRKMMESHVLGLLHVVGNVRPDVRIVVLGSCEEYGGAPVPFHEGHAPLARTGYGVSRLAATLACQSLESPSICVARLAVVYGPGQTGDMFIPSLLSACVAGRPFAMTMGEQTRDFLYVDDAVRALIALADTEAAAAQIVNVGSGIETTVRQVAEEVASLSGGAADIRFGAKASRPDEAGRYVCSIEKLHRLTGWRAHVALQEGFARSLAWWRRRGPAV